MRDCDERARMMKKKRRRRRRSAKGEEEGGGKGKGRGGRLDRVKFKAIACCGNDMIGS